MNMNESLNDLHRSCPALGHNRIDIAVSCAEHWGHHDQHHRKYQAPLNLESCNLGFRHEITFKQIEQIYTYKYQHKKQSIAGAQIRFHDVSCFEFSLWHILHHCLWVRSLLREVLDWAGLAMPGSSTNIQAQMKCKAYHGPTEHHGAWWMDVLQPSSHFVSKVVPLYLV